MKKLITINCTSNYFTDITNLIVIKSFFTNGVYELGNKILVLKSQYGRKNVKRHRPHKTFREILRPINKCTATNFDLGILEKTICDMIVKRIVYKVLKILKVL